MITSNHPIRRSKDGRIRHVDVKELLQHPDGFAMLCDALEEITAIMPDGRAVYDEPPWMLCPDFARGNIAWSVQKGVAILNGFAEWYRNLGPDLRQHYRKRYPEPGEWTGFYDSLA